MVSLDPEFLRLDAVLAKRQRTRNSHYHDIRIGLFTHGVKIGTRSVAWPRREVDQLNAARAAGWSDKKIREFVAALEAGRAAFAPDGGAMLVAHEAAAELTRSQPCSRSRKAVGGAK